MSLRRPLPRGASRRGAALILALVLLAALLLLGLPFLFTQSASVSGTRSFADAKLARIGRDNAQAMAIAVAAYATGTELVAWSAASPPADRSSQWVSLPAVYSASHAETVPRLKASVRPLDEGVNGLPDDDDGAVSLAPEALGLGFNPSPQSGRAATYLGAIITDEAGKLDANSMTPFQWGTLLSAAGITDWDDNVVYEVLPPPAYQCDSDTNGQLAQALASVRFNLPGRRISHLEQLLQVDPQSGTHVKLRFRLTRAELERLRPSLTLHNPRPGRRGLVDLGTVVMETSWHDSKWLDCPQDVGYALLRLGTMIVGERRVAGDHVMGEINSPGESGQTQTLLLGRSLWTGGPTPAARDEALMIEAPATLNVHHLGAWPRAVLGVSGSITRPLDDPGTPIDESAVRTLAGLAAMRTRPSAPQPFMDADLWARIDPVSSAHELPPLGIATNGTFTIDAAATVTDVLGRQTAQEFRRDVVQAVPQEHLLERRWLTQGQMHALLAQRWGSRMQAWPVAVERVSTIAGAAVLADDQDFEDPADTRRADTGMRARPLPDLATSPHVASTTQPGAPWLAHLTIDWRATFGGANRETAEQLFRAECFDGGTIERVEPVDESLLATATVVTDHLRPDGFHRQTGTRLMYPHAGPAATGRPTGVIIERQGSAANEMASRHISLWVKPDADWTAGIHPILETRIPQVNAISPITSPTGVGSTDSQNYLGLWYDAGRELVVLAIAPPTAEHAADYNVSAAFGMPDDLLLTSAVDERSVAIAGAPALAPRALADGGTGLTAFTGVAAPNRVLHCFKTPARGGRPYFREGGWVHLQVAIASDRPEGVSIIVDGVTGRDVYRHDPTAPALTAFGDHCALPTLALRTAIPYQLITSGTAAGPLFLAEIAIEAPAPLHAGHLLPARGMVRIDDEYFTYEAISPDGKKLLRCTRGHRQNTYSTAPDPDGSRQFPNVQAHAAGATVAPGGYRLSNLEPGRRLYRGGAHLAQDFWCGDKRLPPATILPGRVWSRIRHLPPFTDVHPTDATLRVLKANAAEIPIDASNPTWSQFPPRGVVLFQGRWFYYGAKGADTLQQVSAIDGWTALPALNPPPQPFTSDVAFSASNPQPVMVCSILVQGADPTEDGRYTTGNVTDSAKILSLQAPDGRVEWVGYDAALRDGSPAAPLGGFFINADGFYSVPTSTGATFARGMGRTAYAGRSPDVLLFAGNDPDLVFFPTTTTKVIPVQTELSNPGHWLATGDVVTLMPNQPNTATGRVPVQMVVRYAAMDGFPGAPRPALPENMMMDAKNEYFAFSDFLPASTIDAGPPAVLALALNEWEILCGPCWSGEDLTPMYDASGNSSRSRQPRGHLPRLDMFADAWQIGGANPGRMCIGQTDPDRAPVDIGIEATIDGICAGGLTGAAPGLDGHHGMMAPGVQWFWKAGTMQTQLPAGVAALDDLVVQATTQMFPWGLGEMGLVEIGGEVFAYRRPTEAEAVAVAAGLTALLGRPGYGGIISYTAPQIANDGRFARLVARGLLDLEDGHRPLSTGANDAEGPFIRQYTPLSGVAPQRPVIPAKRLPIGPVLQLGSDLVDQTWFSLIDRAGGPPVALPATAALVCAADGTAKSVESLQLIGPKFHTVNQLPPPDPDIGKYTTAPWLRGLYNTLPGTWAATDPRPVVIGWWPRYASALPAAAAGALTTKHFRSRTYPWVGLPFGMHGAYFDPARQAVLPPPYDTLPLAEVEAGDDDGYFEVEARALAWNDDWSGTPRAMDWALQGAVALDSANRDASAAFTPGGDTARSFSDGSTGIPVDGAELRLSWRYATRPTDPTIAEAAEASGRTPVISAARLRCLAPVRVLATERAR